MIWKTPTFFRVYLSVTWLMVIRLSFYSMFKSLLISSHSKVCSFMGTLKRGLSKPVNSSWQIVQLYRLETCTITNKWTHLQIFSKVFAKIIYKEHLFSKIKCNVSKIKFYCKPRRRYCTWCLHHNLCWPRMKKTAELPQKSEYKNKEIFQTVSEIKLKNLIELELDLW